MHVYVRPLAQQGMGHEYHKAPLRCQSHNPGLVGPHHAHQICLVDHPDAQGGQGLPQPQVHYTIERAGSRDCTKRRPRAGRHGDDSHGAGTYIRKSDRCFTEPFSSSPPLRFEIACNRTRTSISGPWTASTHLPKSRSKSSTYTSMSSPLSASDRYD